MRFILFAIFLSAQLLSGQTVSYIIPCCPKHFIQIPELLQHIENQTVIPDEVVISLSQCNEVDPQLIFTVEEKGYPFDLKILKHPERLFAGQNRNSACDAARGHILITQDADDLPHPQRTEVIKHFFMHSRALLLIHKWSPKIVAKSWNPADLALFPIRNMQALNKHSMVVNGCIGLKRRLFKAVRWGDGSHGEDVDFNERATRQFKRTFLIDAELMEYRNHLSSWK